MAGLWGRVSEYVAAAFGGFYGTNRRSIGGRSDIVSPDRDSLYTSFDLRLSPYEVHPLLVGRYAPLIYDYMARSDSQVSADLHLMKNPLMSVTWEIECEDEAIKTYAETALGIAYGGAFDWSQRWREILSSIDMGFALFERMYVTLDEQGMPMRESGMMAGSDMKLYPYLLNINASSISGFSEDKWRELQSVEQITTLGTTRPDGIDQTKVIPGERLFYVSPMRVGCDWWGTSVLRPAFGPWQLKNFYLALQSQADEKWGLPIPRAQYVTTDNDDALQPTVTDRQIDQMQETLIALQSSSRATLIYPKDQWEVDVFASDVKPEFMDRITYNDGQISKAALTNFIDLGTTGHGSRAVGESLSDVFYRSLKGWLQPLVEAVNRDLLLPAVRMNFPNPPMCKLVWDDLSLHALSEHAEAISKLGQAGFLTADPETESTLRRRHDLPQRDPDAPMPPDEGDDTDAD